MRARGLWGYLASVAALAAITAYAQAYAQGIPSQGSEAELRLRIVPSQPATHPVVPAVIWLEPLAGTPALPFPPSGHYTLRQKNRTFIPHLQVIPVGSVVQFPNDDPFFHNVFSNFEGKVFDLGLYEAGSTKSVSFPRAGVSYIFCNIHPEMSAVVLTLSTPLYAVADAQDAFVLRDIPPGDYKLHVWIEGMPQSVLDGLGRTVHFSDRALNLGEIKAPIPQDKTSQHLNKFGKEYGQEPTATY